MVRGNKNEKEYLDDSYIYFLTSCCTNNSSCVAVRAWDGTYSRERIHQKAEKIREENYENESPEKNN
ncbi:hypothetical protein [Glaesserella sp.]|uniref:hypothetical protein n=1 Tax=Glaesserella sp. TaxID=2094731 RepID=UPI0035A0892D